MLNVSNLNHRIQPKEIQCKNPEAALNPLLQHNLEMCILCVNGILNPQYSNVREYQMLICHGKSMGHLSPVLPYGSRSLKKPYFLTSVYLPSKLASYSCHGFTHSLMILHMSCMQKAPVLLLCFFSEMVLDRRAEKDRGLFRKCLSFRGDNIRLYGPWFDTVLTVYVLLVIFPPKKWY